MKLILHLKIDQFGSIIEKKRQREYFLAAFFNKLRIFKLSCVRQAFGKSVLSSWMGHPLCDSLFLLRVYRGRFAT